MNKISFLLVGGFLLIPSLTWAIPIIPGPISAKVTKVYDGDTLTVKAYPWLGLTADIGVRLNGVDTPEIRGKCEEEKLKAIEAREFVKNIVLGKILYLHNIKYGKYAGRVVADVVLESGDSLSEKIISHGLGRQYSGGKRSGWCDDSKKQTLQHKSNNLLIDFKWK